VCVCVCVCVYVCVCVCVCIKQLQLRLSRVRDPREREREIQSLIGTRTSADVAVTYANQGAALQVLSDEEEDTCISY